MGKRVIYCLLVFCLGFLFTACEKDEDFIVIDAKTYSVQQSRLKYWLEYLCSSECEGRKSGTVGNERAREYIVSELKRMSFIPLIQEAVDKEKRTYYNIIVNIGNVSGPTIVIGAHYDGAVESSQYPAANDNASGVASLLLLAQMLADSNTDFRYNYQLVFFDGEETQAGRTSFNGSRFFVSVLKEAPLFYLNIDMIGNAEMFHRIETTSDYLADCVGKIGKKYKRLKLEVDNKIVKYSQDFVPFDAVDIPIFTWKNPLDSSQGKYNHTPEDKLKFLSLEKMEIITSINFDLITYPYAENIFKNNIDSTE
ncbi:M28 family peptidase [Phocaeicola barnesiae]|uniref:M28 family metallopeptidase n=1 Tax=Phocaeicola barnesiae TaxID=376804 RepID=UPI0025A34941|nr:M28 family peptidase [Phocaeicola barnesiae]MDM8252796.1 M28 family peptidase [Phocaeicola barnesiae]